MKKLVILTGAGMSSESGIRTFREAVRITSAADIFVVIGSSLNVYPAAGLIEYAPESASLWLIDPNEVTVPAWRKVEVIRAKASEGVTILRQRLLHDES